MMVMEGKMLYPKLIIKTPTPSLYRDVHQKFKKIFQQYSPNVTPKSIDEAIIDFTPTYKYFNRPLTEIGMEIKRRFRKEIGEWMSCNIGIGTNRFFAKTAAGLHKPNGLDIMDATNATEIYKKLKLIDLCGINTRYEARLNAYGIVTPMQFLEAPLQKLKKQVFRSIVGYYWFLRLRGHEIDAVEFKRKSFGHSYALRNQTNDKAELSKLVMKLCEKTGRRLRRNSYSAMGMHVACLYTDGTYWHEGKKQHTPLYISFDIYRAAMRLLNHSGYEKRVRNLAVSVFDLIEHKCEQLELFNSPMSDVAAACDDMNDRYGEFVITPALMMGMKDTILDRVAFGSVKDLEDLYTDKGDNY
jgi:DNA polymerase-4